MEFSAKQIAEFIQGRVEGDENTTINTFAKIEIYPLSLRDPIEHRSGERGSGFGASRKCYAHQGEERLRERCQTVAVV